MQAPLWLQTQLHVHAEQAGELLTCDSVHVALDKEHGELRAWSPGSGLLESLVLCSLEQPWALLSSLAISC